MEDQFIHKQITLSDGQKVLVRQTQSMQMGIQVDGETTISETVITSDQYSKLKTVRLPSDTISPTGNNTNMTNPIPEDIASNEIVG